ADFARKRLDAQAVEKLNDRLATSWTDIAGEIAAVALTPEHLEKVLTAAGAPLTPQAIHLPRPFYEEALLRCREIRNRYTFLDLAANAGVLAPILPSL
ncbi:MAG TPA: sn-glycerol-1-phosphate dehydrogenase, partial [Nordella sp.]|nr:sn-glycerol-1-phosphate dehydrogenase [Nordella sp.]